MIPDDSDYLLLSGIQHFAFCRRQWALIHIEQAWHENALTISGQLMHERTHNPALTEKRGELIVSRAMPVVSHTLAIRGVCDVVEFRFDKGGISLFGREGLWSPCPVEYKRGRPKVIDADRLQLCAQAICLEEMFACPPIPTAYLYYGETKHREAVPLSGELRSAVCDAFSEMRGYYERRYTPRVKTAARCRNCSLKDICLPEMPQAKQVDAYINDALAEDLSCGYF